MISTATKRSILRWFHILFGIPIIGYVYSPFKEIPNYAPLVRYIFLPALVLSGLWMWKGYLVRSGLFGEDRDEPDLAERSSSR